MFLYAEARYNNGDSKSERSDDAKDFELRIPEDGHYLRQLNISGQITQYIPYACNAASPRIGVFLLMCGGVVHDKGADTGLNWQFYELGGGDDLGRGLRTGVDCKVQNIYE